MQSTLEEKSRIKWKWKNHHFPKELKENEKITIFVLENASSPKILNNLIHKKTQISILVKKDTHKCCTDYSFKKMKIVSVHCFHFLHTSVIY